MSMDTKSMDLVSAVESVASESIKIKAVISAPPDPPLDEGIIYIRQINVQNDGLYVKLKRADTMTEVQLV